MKLAIAFDLGAGPETVAISPFAIIGWEKEHRSKISNLAKDGIGIGDLADLAWRQATLEGRTKLDLEEFERKLVEIDPVDASDPI